MKTCGRRGAREKRAVDKKGSKALGTGNDKYRLHTNASRREQAPHTHKKTGEVFTVGSLDKAKDTTKLKSWNERGATSKILCFRGKTNGKKYPYLNTA